MTLSLTVEYKQLGCGANLHYPFAVIMLTRICGIERLSISLPT